MFRHQIFPPSLFLALALALTLLGLGQGGAQAAPDPLEIVRRVHEKYTQAGSFQAKFQQESRQAGARQGERASGTMFFQKPARMRWQYETPPEQRKEVICDGWQVWIYIPEDALAMVYPLEQVLRSDLVLRFFSDLGLLSRDFHLRWQQPPQPGRPYQIRLEPRKPQPELTSLVVTINPQNHLVEQIEFVNSLGEESRFAFSHITLGSKFAPDFFTFVPPPGVQVIREGPSRR